ncbi:2-oxoisovalerate dehydrogenase subunit beta, mitochondrial [Exophiala dermatitidis]|uniref:3-methyl-2-oxobutanoate dehydrogenase (2-methylpropanoyl-transferring) n=1 Tax=Exophiala dermatitidis (strain ATCC 34100 / CBS 525.76 / NIH/UT8656) TaxID=858893 RepID=H6C2M3_EXODN|nr:2-oxoisovalerate dehydrogenase E1 component, beta subunit [Exophiala dermatitidis NIH/UT8656]EHY57941.1 2-oxoisovalerate dehydrogenase E1 component, beta subunit [Exophiala dermatitidis NIH/UT8656]
MFGCQGGRVAAKFLRSSTQCRFASQASAGARLNRPIDMKKVPFLHQSQNSARTAFGLSQDAPVDWVNLHGAINASLHHALKQDENVLLFGEDVAFGGVFRCSKGLADEFGAARVFNTPLSEQGIVGFAIGCAAEGMRPVAEIQFADYVYPAFDQLVNEAAKFRYREGATGAHCGGLVVRMPCGSVGHGAMYHSQSPEALFTHIPGLRVIMPRSPAQAKGLLTASILECNDPVIFMEPKILYRAAEEFVPREAYTLPLDKAEVIKKGTDLTVISYGQPLYMCSQAIEALEKEIKGLSVELIDLRAIYPWDRATVLESARKTGRAVVVHESMYNAGVGAEIAASIQEGAFLRLEAPVQRVTSWSTHHGLIFEKFYIPDIARIYDAMKKSLEY